MRVLRRRVRNLLLVLPWALLLPSCAVKYSSAALGEYAAYEPFARVNRNLYTVELSQPAHVAVISVVAPQPGYNEAPVFFEVRYPLTEYDRTEFPAGRHRLSPRNVRLNTPRECRQTEAPTLEGCRRTILPGLRGIDTNRAYQRDPQHYLLIAAPERIDPYTLADALYFLALEDEDFAEAFKRRDAEAAADVIERALLNQRMSAGWGGVYVTYR